MAIDLAGDGAEFDGDDTIVIRSTEASLDLMEAGETGEITGDVLLVQAGSIPRTSSGKIGRRACRTAYLDGSLRSGIASPTVFATES